MTRFHIVTLDPANADTASKVAAPGTAAVREIRFGQQSWLPEEIDMLRRLVPTPTPWEEIANRLDRSIAAVRTKAIEIGVCRGHGRCWTEDEDGVLRREYGRVPTSDLAISLDRGLPAIYARASTLGLTGERSPFYSEAEDAVLRALFPTDTTIAEIAARLGRPGSSVVARAYLIGLKRPHGPTPWSPAEQARALALAEAGHQYPAIRTMLAAEGYKFRSRSSFSAFIRSTGYGRGWGRPWIEEESDLLRAAYRDGHNLSQLAHRIGRSVCSIRWKAVELGLSGTHPKPDGARQGRPWSAEDDAILRAHYGRDKMKTRDLAILLDRPKGAVYNRAFTFGLDHGYSRAWTAEEDLIVRIAHDGGISITDLATALDRDPTIVSKRARSMGLLFAARLRRAPRTLRAAREPVTRASILAMAGPPDGS